MGATAKKKKKPRVHQSMSHRLGRPPWIPPDAAKVRGLAQRGLTMEQLAHVLGIKLSTLYEKRAQFADFAEAIRQGRDQGVSIISNVLFKKALAGDTTCMIFFLKSVGGWKDNGEGALINVNINNGQVESGGGMRALIAAMTLEEKRDYLLLMQKAQARLKGSEIEQPAIETTAEPMGEEIPIEEGEANGS